MIVAAVREQDRAAVVAVSPLAADLLLVAGPFTVPVALLAGADRIGPDDAEIAEALRAFLDEDPWAGPGSVEPEGWMLLVRDDTTIVIGRREGPIGVGQIVTLGRENCRFRAETMDGPRLATGVPGQRVEPVYDATVEGETLTLGWDSGADHSGAPLRRVVEVRVHAGPDAVHVLLVSEPTDTFPADAWVAGTGRGATTTVRLDAPLGRRQLCSDHRVPAAIVAPSNDRG